MVFHSTWTLVCSSSRLKMVRLLGSDSVPTGKLVRPLMVAVSARGNCKVAGSTSRPAELPPMVPLLPPQPASRDIVKTTASARDISFVNLRIVLLLYDSKMLGYPFTAPAIIPLSKYFWKKGYRIIRGTLEMIMVAYFRSSASCARAAVLCISETMPGSGWL